MLYLKPIYVQTLPFPLLPSQVREEATMSQKHALQVMPLVYKSLGHNKNCKIFSIVLKPYCLRSFETKLHYQQTSVIFNSYKSLRYNKNCKISVKTIEVYMLC